MSPKVGIVLSGCGVFDGSEIHEAVFTILAADKAGASISYIAPDMDQLEVINHARMEPDKSDKRNVLKEAARIARGNIRAASEVNAKELDALLFPGGFGAAKNLCNFATRGPDCDVNADIERLIREMHSLKRPMGFACIAPAVAAKVLGEEKVKLTIGNDTATAGGLRKLGAEHEDHPVTEICFDSVNRVVSTPAYMYGEARPSEVAEGIEKMVNKVLSLIEQEAAVG